MLREGAGREPSPTAVVIDTQSVKTTESGGLRGWDAAKSGKALLCPWCVSTPTGLSPNLPIEISPGWDGDQPLA